MLDEIKLDENGMENMDGVKGSKPVGHGYDPQIGTPVHPPLKEADLPKYADILAKAKGTPEYQALLDMFEGPDTGVDYKEATGTFRIADGWTIKDGYIVKE